MAQLIKSLLFLLLAMLIVSCGDSDSIDLPILPFPPDIRNPQDESVPTNLQLKGNSTALQGECVGFRIALLDKVGKLLFVKEACEVELSGEGKGNFFATPTCANPFGLGTITSIPIIKNEQIRMVYYKNEFTETVKLVASHEDVESATLKLEIQAKESP